MSISKLLPTTGSSCEYIYDFGDNWRHDIVLESILPVTPRKRYPVCVAGARSGPPEDVGGTDGYARYLDALLDLEHPQHDAMLMWRGRFDPDHFPITTVNRRLKEEFPLPSSRVGNPPASLPSRDSTLTKPFEGDLTLNFGSLLQSGRLSRPKTMQIRPDETIPLTLSARDCELIVDYTLAGSDITQSLQPNSGSTANAQLFYFTLDEIEELTGHIAAEANHASKKAQKEWDELYDRLERVMDAYTR